MRPGPKRPRGLSLVEIIVASAILVIAMLGVSSAYLGIQRNQFVGRQRQAAMLAALSVIEEIQIYAENNPDEYPSNLDLLPNDTPTAGLFNQVPFHVYNASTETGADKGATGAAGSIEAGSVSLTGAFLVPATDASLFPASRASGSHPYDAVNADDVVDYAGYIEITLPDSVNRPNLRQVTVYVAWKGYSRDESIAYTVLLGPKE